MAYRSPGVRIQEVPNLALAGQPSGVRIPAVVGTGSTTTAVPDYPLTKGTTNSTESIIDPLQTTVLGVTAVGDVPGLSQYKYGTDYLVVNNNVVWQNGGTQPSTGAAYYVSFLKAKDVSAYNNGNLWFSIKDVRTNFGPELNNGIANPITIAAAKMFENGAAAVMIVQATTGSQTDLQTGIDALQAEEIDVMSVPQATNTTLINYIRTHVRTQSSPASAHERFAVIGGTLNGLSPSISEQTGIAVAMATKRVIVVSPPATTLVLRDNATNQDTTVLLPASWTSGPAFAGLMTNANFDPAEPLTRKPITGVVSLSTFNYLPSQMDTLAVAGITVMDSPSGFIRVRQALTTGTGNINDLSVSVALIIDNIRKDMRTQLDREFIGTKILPSTPSAVATSIKAVLEQKVKDKILADFSESSISVVQDQTDPRTLNVSFAVAPVYPVEYIDVTFSLFVAA